MIITHCTYNRLGQPYIYHTSHLGYQILVLVSLHFLDLGETFLYMYVHTMSVVTDSQAYLTHCRHSALSRAHTLPAAAYDFLPDTIHSYFALYASLKGLFHETSAG